MIYRGAGKIFVGGDRVVSVLEDSGPAHHPNGAGARRGALRRGGRLPDGRLLVTSWNDSSLLVVEGSERRRVIAGLSLPADFGIDTRRGRVAIPLVMINRVEVCELPGDQR